MRVQQLLAAGAATLVSAGAALVLSVLGVAGAHAAPPPGTLGTLTMDPPEGSDLLAPSVTSSAGCAAGSEGYVVKVSGPGAFEAGFVITTFADANLSTTEGFTMFFGLNMKDAATELGTTIVPGEYPVTAECLDAFSNVLGTFTMSMVFDSPTHYTTDSGGGTTTTSTTTTTTTTTSTTSTTTTAATTSGSSTSTTTSGPPATTTEPPVTTTEPPFPGTTGEPPPNPGPLASTGAGEQVGWLFVTGLSMLILGCVYVGAARPRRAR